MKRFFVCLMVMLTMSMAMSTAYAAPKKGATSKKAKTTSVAKGSSDWNSLLNSYDSYVTKYISYMKKAQKGDMSALAQYPALMEKAQELNNKLSNAQGEMSEAQWARYMKITNKLSQAAASMR